jgi:hypothetical protein
MFQYTFIFINTKSPKAGILISHTNSICQTFLSSSEMELTLDQHKRACCSGCTHTAQSCACESHTGALLDISTDFERWQAPIPPDKPLKGADRSHSGPPNGGSTRSNALRPSRSAMQAAGQQQRHLCRAQQHPPQRWS